MISLPLHWNLMFMLLLTPDRLKSVLTNYECEIYVQQLLLAHVPEVRKSYDNNTLKRLLKHFSV